jgi:ubiquinone/menaquinone biosynthesis C-methylase UbiE
VNDELFQSVAAQLRKPEGEYALTIAEKMNESNLLLNTYTIEALDITEGDSILEIGMGNGYFVKQIVESDTNVIYSGCDYSPAMIEESIRLNQDLVDQSVAQFHLADAHDLPFPDSSFTKIFTVNTIYFWEDVGAVLAEFSRLLKSGGILTIAVRPKEVMQQYPFTQYGFTMYSREELEQTLTDKGYEVTQSIEKDEPDQDVTDFKIPVASLIVSAKVIVK